MCGSVCNAEPLSEDALRRALPYMILALLMYTSVLWIGAGMSVCWLLGVRIDPRWLGPLLAGAILIKRFGTLFVLRQLAPITGDRAPEIALWGHLGYIVAAGLFLLMSWR